MASPSKSAKPKPAAKPKRKTDEADLQAACVSWIRTTYPPLVVFSVPNEACFKAREKYKRTGMLPGVPDLVVLLPGGSTILLELKSPIGRCSPEQVEVHKQLQALQHPIYVVRTLESFKDIINNYVRNACR